MVLLAALLLSVGLWAVIATRRMLAVADRGGEVD